MKKVVPIILIILAAVFLLIGGAGFITIIVAMRAMPELAVIAVPFLIVPLIGASVTVALSMYLKKSALCRVSAVIAALAFLVALVGIIIWLAVL